ncbi:MAG TPA: HAMP domain-containing sensor histidine kinase [Myxococcota bacterium]|jgi:signal transduction histidine kinase|nr:HAMP domain-containing sensor histidine kinase [Myxococcota bacterium]
MAYPPFIAAIARPADRHKLWFSVTSGYALAALFAALAAAAQALGAIHFDARFYALVAFKVVANTLALWSLRADRLVVEAATLNVIADALAMTGAIYLTGGVVSPLIAIYSIEITVIALLTNLGVTILMAAGLLLLFAAMAAATYFGALPYVPAPSPLPEAPRLVAAGILNAAFVLGVPTFFCALIVRLLRRRERALVERTEALVEASRAKSQFMVNVTHELRTPIHGICGLSDLVSTEVYGPVTARQREAQADIKRSAQGLLRLVDDLLTLARSDAGRIALEPGEVDLGELVDGVVGVVRWMQGTRALELGVALEPELPHLWTDRAKLNQVLLNLMTNAVKFTPEGGRIDVRVRRAGGDGDDAVTIAVSDTGPGIPPAARARIFDDFWQADGSPERAYGGAGVGLAVVRRLLVLLDGRIDVESEEGRGSTFTVWLPVRANPTAAGDGGAPSPRR